MLGGIFDKNKIKEKIQVFDKKIANKNFWQDKIIAQKILKEKKFFDNIINNFHFTMNELENIDFWISKPGYFRSPKLDFVSWTRLC